MQNTSDVDYTLSSIEAIIKGSFIGGDFPSGALKLAVNNSAVLAGSTNLFNTNLVGTQPQDKLFYALAQTIAAGQSKYFILTIDIDTDAVTGHTIYVDGDTNPLVTTWGGSPSVVNNQTNIGGTVTVGV